MHVADLLVNALGIGTSGERFVPPLDPTGLGGRGAFGRAVLEVVIPQAVNQFNTLEFLLQA